jgi:hypothetical protein
LPHFAHVRFQPDRVEKGDRRNFSVAPAMSAMALTSAVTG